MSSSLAAPRLSPELRAAIYHFTVYGTSGVASVYFAIWLINRGIGADEIGIINAAPVFAMLAINVLIGRLADKAKDWRQMIIILSMLAGAIPIGLFFVSGFWGILLVWTLSMVPALALVPVTDAATLRMTQRRGTNFATLRGWGTIGYLLTTAASGPLIAWLGDGAFLPLFVAFALCRSVLSLQLPLFRAEGAERQAGAGRLREVLKPWFLFTLLGLGVLYGTHSALSAFAALLWMQQGISEGWIGPLFAVGAAAEAAMMFLWTRLRIKLSARHIIIVAALLAALRWAVMAFSPPVWVIFLLQMLHSVTFAMGYLGGIYFIANWTSEEIAAEAQGFSYVVQQAMSVTVLVAMGWGISAFGNHAWFGLAAFALFGAGLVVISLYLKPPAPGAVPASAVEPGLRPGEPSP